MNSYPSNSHKSGHLFHTFRGLALHPQGHISTSLFKAPLSLAFDTCSLIYKLERTKASGRRHQWLEVIWAQDAEAALHHLSLLFILFSLIMFAVIFPLSRLFSLIEKKVK